ncbi:GNAT family N-acetyltransferase [Paenibacillus sp. GYB003]|uniref:GNAT family N-acetyltransferase n=1 Tax=Paenibacillus sp. GYB003 TaxID=2994392 RepID=UPI002F968C95
MKCPAALEGHRVVLKAMEPSHADELYECGNHPDIWTYLPCRMESHRDLAEFVESALRDRETGLDYPFVVYDKSLRRLVGSTRFLNISVPNRNLEIGYTWYTPEVWRTRVNTECKYLLLRHCFEQMKTVRVQLKADVRNVRSNNAIERIGAVREGIMRQDRILPDGYCRSSYIYSIIDSEWPAVKLRLEPYLKA